MRSVVLAAASIALLLPVAAAQAEDLPAQQAEAPKPAKPPKPKKICREEEASSASRMAGGKTCRTAEDWAKIDAAGGKERASRSVQTYGGQDH